MTSITDIWSKYNIYIIQTSIKKYRVLDLSLYKPFPKNIL